MQLKSAFHPQCQSVHGGASITLGSWLGVRGIAFPSPHEVSSLSPMSVFVASAPQSFIGPRSSTGLPRVNHQPRKPP